MGVVAFTGTNTGNVYVVGQSYSMAGKTYTAGSDGKFYTTASDGSVRSTVGSSQSPTATFYVSQSLASGGGGSSPIGAVKGAASAAAVTASSVPYTGQGPGSLPSAALGVYDADAWSKLPETTQLWWDSTPLPRNMGTSDIQDFEDRYGDAELGNPTWFASWGVWGGDVIAGVEYELAKFGNEVATRWAAGDNPLGWLEAMPANSPQTKQFDADWEERRNNFVLQGTGL